MFKMALYNYRSRTLSRQPSLNVLQHKKQITLPNKVEKVPVAAKKEGKPKKKILNTNYISI